MEIAVSVYKVVWRENQENTTLPNRSAVRAADAF
jgi:hypothetical protein